MAKGKSTFYLDEYISDLVRYYGGSRFIEGMTLLAYLGGFVESSFQCSSSWNQKSCPDPDNYQLYPNNPEAWQKGICGLRKRERDDADEHAHNLLKEIDPEFSDEENAQLLAHYLRTWVL